MFEIAEYIGIIAFAISGFFVLYVINWIFWVH